MRPARLLLFRRALRPALLALIVAGGHPGFAQEAVQDGSRSDSITRIGQSSVSPSLSDTRARTDASGAAEAAETAAQPEASGSAKSCASAYHASLKRIEAGEFAKVEAARRRTVEGDPLLPGMLLFPPKPGTRGRAEMAALAAANTLARAKGRPGGPSDADGSWIANRLRVDLSDYLGQKETPFLCGGVPQYVERLRQFAERTGTSPERRRSLRDTQSAAARRSIAAALGAMRPVPIPSFAPADRPTAVLAEAVATGGIEGLRPAAGLSRADTMKMAPTPETPSDDDPDLPPSKPAPALALDTVSDLAAAIDLLLSRAKEAGFVTEPVNQMAIGGDIAVSPTSHPVLARLARARQYVAGERPLVEDRGVRLALAGALSDIEALDYLTRAESEPGDPMSAALFATLDAILSAHAGDCTCGR